MEYCSGMFGRDRGENCKRTKELFAEYANGVKAEKRKRVVAFPLLWSNA